MKAYLSGRSIVQDLRSITYGFSGALWGIWVFWREDFQMTDQFAFTALGGLITILAVMRLKRSIHLRILTIFAVILIASLIVQSW